MGVCSLLFATDYNPKDFTKNAKISAQAIEKAIVFYNKNKSQKKITKPYIAVADFTMKATNKRLAIIDLENKKIEYYLTSHGENSGKAKGVGEVFSDVEGSKKTPPGFLKFSETYMSAKNGLSIRLDGLEDRNKNSRKRLVVMHGADYVSSGGRSQGCPAVEKKYMKSLAKNLANGALLYHYTHLDRKD